MPTVPQHNHSPQRAWCRERTEGPLQHILTLPCRQQQGEPKKRQGLAPNGRKLDWGQVRTLCVCFNLNENKDKRQTTIYILHLSFLGSFCLIFFSKSPVARSLNLPSFFPFKFYSPCPPSIFKSGSEEF